MEIENNNGSIEISKDIQERKKKIIHFLKTRINFIVYTLLTLIIILNVYIRMLPIPKLKDVTTGTWTLGPDLDPFLFLRWAEYIVEHGKLMAIDTMRYVPLGYDTSGEMKLLSYMIAWFHYPVEWITGETSVTYAAILFPVFMSILTAIAFFLFARKLFYKESNLIKNSIALIGTLIFVLVPSILPRTIAGIPEKESAAFFFMFMALYFFLEAYTSEKFKKGIICGILAGAFTAGMALIWGGVLFVFLAVPSAILIYYLFGSSDKREFWIYTAWLVSSFLLMIPFSTRYTPMNLLMSLSTGWAIGIFCIIGLCLLLSNLNILDKLREKSKIPKKIFYFLFVIVFLLIIILLVNRQILYEQVVEIKNSMTTPIVDRFGMTVAENRQPYFKGEWDAEFGPIKLGIPLYFWMLFIGAILLFYNMIHKFSKKEKILLTLSYIIFLLCLVFSRYSSESILNGESNISKIVYFSGWILFLFSFAQTYYRRNKNKELDIFKSIDFNYVLYFIIFTLGLISARGGIRLIMVLGAISPIAASFLIVKTTHSFWNKKDEMIKIFTGLVALVLIISLFITLYQYYQQDKYTGENYAPGMYNQQWQKAMEWVRNNTPETSVFSHWWDYGYWIQSIGKRATVLDGGNNIVYWNHLLGRHVLCGYTEKEAIDFLYTHNATHLLIDSTDIGKYTAFSSIGGDENYDKFSWIQPFLLDDRQTTETNNQTIYVYVGGSGLDEDIVIKKDGKEILLPKKNAGVGAIVFKKENEKISQPEVIFVYNGNQYNEKLRYVYAGNQLYDFGSGLDAGIFIFPRADQSTEGKFNMNEIGAAFYLSGRTIHTNLVQLYLFDKKSENFRLAHTESNFVIESLREQGLNIGEFLYFQGFQGPIKIWEIKYPLNIKENSEYLSTEYPENVKWAKKGEYN